MREPSIHADIHLDDATEVLHRLMEEHIFGDDVPPEEKRRPFITLRIGPPGGVRALLYFDSVSQIDRVSGELAKARTKLLKARDAEGEGKEAGANG